MANNEITTGIDGSLLERTNEEKFEPTTGIIDSSTEELVVQERPIGYDWKILTPAFDLPSTKNPILKETTTTPTSTKNKTVSTQRPALTANTGNSRSYLLILCFAMIFLE